MNLPTFGWVGLVAILCVSTFGSFWCFTLVLGLVAFLVGLLTILYLQNGSIEEAYFHSSLLQNPLMLQEPPLGGLKKVVHLLVQPKVAQKMDRRVTGSDIIDSSLQEILGYVIRDYVQPWYGAISQDTSFSEQGVRKCAQALAINVSNRVKEVDWLPFLTTRLVDDAATHLRLFRQARAKQSAMERPRSPRGSPLRPDVHLSPKRTHRRNKSETDVCWHFGSCRDGADPDATLEEHFFDLECKMEGNLVCRDAVSMDSARELELLAELTELLLYMLLPDEDFQCKPLRFVLRDLLACGLLRPLLSLASDPDYINQVVVWLCFREAALPGDAFLAALRTTDSCDELRCTRDLVAKEIQQLRSRDSGGEADMAIKQQLSSLQYVVKVIDGRLAKLRDAAGAGTGRHATTPQPQPQPLRLPLDAILQNNVALSYFIDHVACVGRQSYLFFYLHVEGWRVTAEQQLRAAGPGGVAAARAHLRDSALHICDQYLSERSPHRLQLHAGLVQALLARLADPSDPPTEHCFDEVRRHLHDQLRTRDEFLPGFLRSESYLRLLADLDLLQPERAPDEDDELGSEPPDPEGAAEHGLVSLPLPPPVPPPPPPPQHRPARHARSHSDIAAAAAAHRTDVADGTSYRQFEPSAAAASPGTAPLADEAAECERLRAGGFSLAADIIEAGIVCDKGKTFGVYATQVTKMYDSGFLEQWHIYRRYSDFHDLHGKVKERCADLAKLPFPGKKTFHNMDRVVLERRMRMLNAYMQEVCRRAVVDTHPGLRPLLLTFVEQGDYDRAAGGPISHTIDTLRSGMRSIRSVPEQLIHTVDEVVAKVFQRPERAPPEAGKVGAALDADTDDNIPLRIMLLLADEVFDLRSRNQWLRRRIVILLRQIIRTMFGDIVNRRIVDYVSLITGPANVAHYLDLLKHSLWPNGTRAERRAGRAEAARCRTRVAAKAALLSALSDELKHIIGSETARRGLLTVFDLFQRPVLNRRLLHVLVEGFLATLLPEKDMACVFQQFHRAGSRRLAPQ